MQDIIAESVFDCIDPHGQKLKITVQIGRPCQSDKSNIGDASCSVMVHGLDTKPRDIYGVNTLQALCLAARYAWSLLDIFRESGGRLDTSELPEDEEAEELTLEKLMGATFGIR